MVDLNKLFLCMIRSEVFGKEPEPDIKKHLNDDTISELFTLSVKHDLSCIIISALDRMGVLDDSEDAKKKRKKIMVSALRDGQKEHAMKTVSDIFEENEIPYLPLKGAVIRHLYPQTWMRTSCDIDVLIHESDAQKAIDKLCQNGFERKEDQTKHDYSLETPGGVNFELHYVLTTQGRLPEADEILSSVWDYAQTTESGFKYSMTTEMFLLYHVVHMAKHFFNGGCGVRPFIDLKLLQQKMNFNIDVLNELMDRANIRRFYECVSNLCDVWFDEETHNALTEQIESFVFTGGVYGTRSNSAKIKAARGDSSFKVFFKLVFLSPSDLSIVYPELKKHPKLFLFYQVKRWFRIFNRNKRMKVKSLTHARNSVVQSDIDATSSLLKSMGLKNEM